MLQGGLFASPHTDENDVQTISHKCSVFPLKEYSRHLAADVSTTPPGGGKKHRKPSSSGSGGGGDVFYLAGSYDPTLMSVSFQPGVLKQ